MKTSLELRRLVSEYSRAIHDRGWVANHDGNVSLRGVGEARFWITPTAVSKRLCTPDTIVLCDLAGEPLQGGKPPSEKLLHVGAYRAREDVFAVIHAHPPHASAYSLVGRTLDPIAMPEVMVSLGSRIPLVPLVVPKDPSTADLVALAVAEADVALLAGNGVLSCGADLEQAFLRLELLEHYATIHSYASGSGPIPRLDPATQNALLEARRQAGLGPPGPKGKEKIESSWVDRVRPIVSEELKRALARSK